MTVEELINELRRYPSNSVVVVECGETWRHGHAEYNTIERTVRTDGVQAHGLAYRYYERKESHEPERAVTMVVLR